MNREAQILQALPTATLSEQRALVDELNTLRAQASARVAAARELELGDDIARAHLTPVRTYARHTTDTDWLGKVADTNATSTQVHTAAKAEASAWFASTSPLARADAEEFMIQAEGYAQHWAGQYGAKTTEAVDSFLQQAMHLGGFRRAATRKQADGRYSEIEQWCDQNGCVMKDLPDDLVEQVADSGDLDLLDRWADYTWGLDDDPRTGARRKKAARPVYNEDGEPIGTEEEPMSDEEFYGPDGPDYDDNWDPDEDDDDDFADRRKWIKGGARKQAASESDPHVILRVVNSDRSLEEIQRYLYSGWQASQVEDGTIYIDGHDDGGGFGLNALRDRLLSGLIGTEIVSSDGQGTKWASRRQANQYIQQRGDKWVITQKGTGKVLSEHDSKEKAEASFRAMMWSKHSSVVASVLPRLSVANRVRLGAMTFEQAVAVCTKLAAEGPGDEGPDESSQNGYAESGLPQIEVGDAPENSNLGDWIDGDDEWGSDAERITASQRLADGGGSGEFAITYNDEDLDNSRPSGAAPMVDTSATDDSNLGWIDDEDYDMFAPEG